MRHLTGPEIEQVAGGGIVICNSVTSCITIGLYGFAAAQAAWTSITTTLNTGGTVNVSVDEMGNVTGFLLVPDDGKGTKTKPQAQHAEL